MIERGTKINSWTYLYPSKSKKHYGWFQCDCGEKRCVSVYTVLNGKSKSCKHCSWNKFGLEKNDYNAIIYSRRRAINRCYNKNNPSYKRYGGRGISVCKEWLESQDSFVTWALSNGWERGLSLDRIDNDKNYSPDNCRWANAKKQANNRSSCIFIEHDGETKTMMEWCEFLGVPHWLPNNRWQRGERNFSELFSPVDKRTGVVIYY